MLLHSLCLCCGVKHPRNEVKLCRCVYSQHAFGLGEDGTARICEVSSKEIFRKGTIFPSTIEHIRNTSEVNGKIQGYLLKQKAVTHTLYVNTVIQNLPHAFVSTLKFMLSFSYLHCFSLALPLV